MSLMSSSRSKGRTRKLGKALEAEHPITLRAVLEEIERR
jgi:hypothetical protein